MVNLTCQDLRSGGNFARQIGEVSPLKTVILRLPHPLLRYDG